MKVHGYITGEVRTGSRSLWPMFARTIISAAKFVTRFPTSEAFIDWINYFRKSDDTITIAALPLILSQEVYGLGLPLAADFLKELGVSEFPKPDRHVTKLANSLDISVATAGYRLMRDLMMAARQIGMTPYALDKLLWLVGSGRFYRTGVEDREKGFVTIKIGGGADKFIAHMATVAWKDEQATDKPSRATSYSASP